MVGARLKKLIIPLLAMAVILACGPFAAATPQPAATLNALYTSAAQTLGALSTQAVITLTQQPLQASSTPTSELNFPTASPVVFSTFTPVPPLATVSRCDAAEFVGDVTFPDGSIVSSGKHFHQDLAYQECGHLHLEHLLCARLR